jgi:hypothetical protein
MLDIRIWRVYPNAAYLNERQVVPMFTDGQHNQPPWLTGNLKVRNPVGDTIPADESHNHSPPPG